MIEEWRAVPYWEGFYEVSNLGRVRSVARPTFRRDKHGRLQVWGLSGRVLSPARTKMGLQVNLCGRGLSVGALVHRLVLSAFVGSAPGGEHARHRDGDKTNNRLDNLYWAARDEVAT